MQIQLITTINPLHQLQERLAAVYFSSIVGKAFFKSFLLEPAAFEDWVRRSFFIVSTQLAKAVYLAAESHYHKTEEEILAENDLVERAKQNPRHFGVIYDRYYSSIFIYINRRVEDEETTADLTAQVFYNALHNIKKYQFKGLPFSAWLFRVAINEINQHFRKSKRQVRSVSLQGHHIDLLFEEIDIVGVEVTKEEVVSSLLQTLDNKELHYLELRFFEKRSFKDIGFLLGVTETNAKVKTYRILKKLRATAKKLKISLEG